MITPTRGTIRNAKITSTKLGFDRGFIMSCWLHLDYGGGGQGFGGYCLWNMHEESKSKETLWGANYIEQVLKVCGVEYWENLPGTFIRVDSESGKVHGIGNVLADKWFYPTNE